MGDIILKRGQISKSWLDSDSLMLDNQLNWARKLNDDKVFLGFQNYEESRQYQIFCADSQNCNEVFSIIYINLIFPTSTTHDGLYFSSNHWGVHYS